jgi:hypothetical protein
VEVRIARSTVRIADSNKPPAHTYSFLITNGKIVNELQVMSSDALCPKDMNITADFIKQ